MYKMQGNRTASQNQISLFDFADNAQKEGKHEPAILLHKGQKVWLVDCGDVSEWTVVDNWVYADDRRYRVKNILWNSICNKDIGVSAFTDQYQAEVTAEKYLCTHEIIRKENMHPIEQKAFCYIRKCDSRRMVSFYAILPDGKVYIEGFMTYAHIIDCKSIEEARKYVQKEFFKQSEFQYHDDITDCPETFCKFRNMYPCHKNVDWDYSVPEYNGVRKTNY